MNNNKIYVLQIGYATTSGQVLRMYIRFKDEYHQLWVDVE